MIRKRDSVICIAAHGNAWDKMKKYCFNSAFRHHRDKFDLCVVLNGGHEQTAQFIQEYLEPEYLVVRENTGLDQGAFDTAIKTARGYETYILMHYDHHFSDYNWFTFLHNRLYELKCDVLGNIVRPSTKHLPIDFDEVAKGLGYGELEPGKFEGFIQGCAGFYKGAVIKFLLDRGGIPHAKEDNRNIACICERLLSFLLLQHGFLLDQIPPGYEQYLYHAEHS